MRPIFVVAVLASLAACGPREPRRLTAADLAGLDPGVAQEMLRQQAMADEERRTAQAIRGAGILMGIGASLLTPPPAAPVRCERQVWSDGSYTERCGP